MHEGTYEHAVLPRLVRPDPDPSVELVPGQLGIGLVLETEATTRRVTHEDLARWGRSLEDLMPRARENLAARSSAAGWELVRTVPGMRLYRPDSGDAASRALLLHELIEPWPLAGVVFAVPSPDQLLVVPIHHTWDLEAVRVLVTAAAYAAEAMDDPLSDQLFWVFDDRVEWLRVRDEDEDDGVEVLPTPRFIEALERLTSVEIVSSAGEA